MQGEAVAACVRVHKAITWFLPVPSRQFVHHVQMLSHQCFGVKGLHTEKAVKCIWGSTMEQCRWGKTEAIELKHTDLGQRWAQMVSAIVLLAEQAWRSGLQGSDQLDTAASNQAPLDRML